LRASEFEPRRISSVRSGLMPRAGDGSAAECATQMSDALGTPTATAAEPPAVFFQHRPHASCSLLNDVRVLGSDWWRHFARGAGAMVLVERVALRATARMGEPQRQVTFRHDDDCGFAPAATFEQDFIAHVVGFLFPETPQTARLVTVGERLVPRR